MVSLCCRDMVRLWRLSGERYQASPLDVLAATGRDYNMLDEFPGEYGQGWACCAKSVHNGCSLSVSGTPTHATCRVAKRLHTLSDAFVLVTHYASSTWPFSHKTEISRRRCRS